jgi:hypothetical protein
MDGQPLEELGGATVEYFSGNELDFVILDGLEPTSYFSVRCGFDGGSWT